MQTNRGAPTPPIAFGDGDVHDHLRTPRVEVDDATRERLRSTGAELVDTAATLAEASRDWWPLAMIWALDAQVAVRASLIVKPHDAAQVQAVLRICNEARIPVTAAAGRSGVCGASLPVFALGGMTPADLQTAWRFGAQGIAMVRGSWRRAMPGD